MKLAGQLIPHVLSIASLLTGMAVPGAAAQTDIPDSRIHSAIEDEYQTARHVSPNRMDIEVNEGIVTLEGTVPTILEKDRAVRIARMVKGVRSVVNNLEVVDGGRSDSEIRNDVNMALAADPATESWEIDVRVRDGRVTLMGDVDSYAERSLAATIARGVRGVRAIDNAVNVLGVEDRPDREIRQEIRQRLRWDARIDDALVNVEVSGGRVTLSGAVGSAHERRLAMNDAWVEGVTSVDAGNLDVEWWARDDMQRTTAWASLADSKIQEAVKDALLYDPRVTSFRPTVSVSDGVVILSGQVDNLKARRAAAQDAANTVGVRRVKNYLKVRPDEDRADSAIESNIREAFLRDPIVERHEITVDVVDGTAHLYGDVDSYFDRAMAENLAARTKGVTEVENHLHVGYPIVTYDVYHDWDPVLHDYDYDVESVTVKSDAVILEDIESELFWSPFVDSDEVNVSVSNGVATLTGTVDSWSEYDAATENAIEGGAVRVINRLDVETE